MVLLWVIAAFAVRIGHRARQRSKRLSGAFLHGDLSGEPLPAREGDIKIGPCSIRSRRCLIRRFDGVILSKEWEDALWDKFVTEAARQRTPSEQ
jgi:hypothetical protein